MAKVVSTAYVDDLDGSEASIPVEFSLDGKAYEIDLSAANSSRLRDALAPYIAAARRSGTAGRRATAAPAAPRHDLGDVREALRGLGYPVKDRGRISADLMAAYESRTPAPAQLDAEDSPPPKSKKRGRKSGSESNEPGAVDGKVVQFRSA
jgi:hypothetical protein